MFALLIGRGPKAIEVKESRRRPGTSTTALFQRGRRRPKAERTSQGYYRGPNQRDLNEIFLTLRKLYDQRGGGIAPYVRQVMLA